MKKNKTKRNKEWAIKHLGWFIYKAKQFKGKYHQEQLDYALSIYNRK